MTVSEYEERFRASAPSLHETFTEMRGPSRGRWRRRRLWTAAGGRDIVRPAGGRGMTVLLVEHDMEVVFSLANKINVLHRGAVIADGTPQAIKNDAEVQRA